VKALVFVEERTVRFESVPTPVLEAPTDVLVEIRLAAVCGSDLHPYHGRERGLDPGTVMGHEMVGAVVETGASVTTLKPGDRVACPFTTSCGRCFYCSRGLTSRCPSGQLFGWVERGRGLQGTQAQHVRVPLAESTLLKLPDSVSDEDGLLLGDVLPTGFYCAELAGADDSGVFVVIGCGPVGLMAVAAARHLGAKRLVAVDSVPERLGLAVDLVRPGGVVASVGVHTEAHFAFAPAEAYDRNLTYRTGRCPARHYMERLLPLVAEGRLAPSAVISHRMPLEDGPRAYALFDERRDGCTKVVLAP
jgi:threonine dehydrogenase-like Zn-dependent dehydrogenase